MSRQLTMELLDVEEEAKLRYACLWGLTPLDDNKCNCNLVEALLFLKDIIAMSSNNNVLLSVDEIQQRDFDVLFAANTKMIPPRPSGWPRPTRRGPAPSPRPGCARAASLGSP